YKTRLQSVAHQRSTGMKVVFYIEPAIFWKNPTQLTAHFIWLRMLLRALGTSDQVLLASSSAVCAEWGQEEDNQRVSTYSIDSYKPLKYFQWSRSLYSAALYGTGDDCEYLEQCLN